MTSTEVGILVKKTLEFPQKNHVVISIENISKRGECPNYICSFDIVSDMVRYHSHEFDICTMGLIEIENIKKMLGYGKKIIEIKNI